ncbi:copper chaperone PCu(A)C [Acidisoma cellulosilytica]|uniref:Copper chaperone PCu(A)C n=1 Tax=Acidisoma cellulosilyticum TaxID=2802395 RepID=A0A963Z3D7_9PROT|nr:copper chaperone PCu(A)C [Acidisoma cellulosilyticum]MCB8881801.1 copper chaperone PCu(A)C [Acidisoma cellulosilyticum]
MRRMAGLSMAAGFLSLAVTIPAFAADSTGIVVTAAWSRITPIATIPAVVYLTVTDSGAPDQLTAAATPIAQTASLHQSHLVNGLMVMDPVTDLPVSSGHPLMLSPDGYHIMLEGLSHSLTVGETFPLTLTFAHAGPVKVTVTVQPMTYMPPAPIGAPAMSGMKM